MRSKKIKTEDRRPKMCPSTYVWWPCRR